MNRTKHYNWKEIQVYYDEGHTLNDCKTKFGFHHASWTKAVNRGEIKPRLSSGKLDLIPTEQLKSRAQIKQRLLKNGVLEYKCAICFNPGKHLGKRLSLQLDHIDGDKHNNEIENLRLLCPNCHHQQPTSNGSNKKHRRMKLGVLTEQESIDLYNDIHTFKDIPDSEYDAMWLEMHELQMELLTKAEAIRLKYGYRSSLV